MVLFANDPNIGNSGSLRRCLSWHAAPVLLGPIVIDKLYKYFYARSNRFMVLAGNVSDSQCMERHGGLQPHGPDAMKMFLIGIAIAAICVIIDHFAKGIVQSLAVLIAMVAGYVFCSVTGMVDFSQVGSAAWVAVPRPLNFGMTVNLGAVITVFIIHIATIMENSGNTTGVVAATDEAFTKPKGICARRRPGRRVLHPV